MTDSKQPSTPTVPSAADSGTPTPAASAILSPGSVSAAGTSGWIRSIVFVALFAALFIGASFVKSAPGAAIPFSMQTFAIMLTGGLLGAVYGFWSIFLVVALTAIGLPLMNGPGGFAQVFGPTGGFIWMFPISALLIGWACDRLFSGNRAKLNLARFILLLLTMLLFGVLLVYITGVPWLAHVSKTMDFADAIQAGMVPFIPIDIVKAVAAAIIVAAVRPLIKAVRPRSRSNR